MNVNYERFIKIFELFVKITRIRLLKFKWYILLNILILENYIGLHYDYVFQYLFLLVFVEPFGLDCLLFIREIEKRFQGNLANIEKNFESLEARIQAVKGAK